MYKKGKIKNLNHRFPTVQGARSADLTQMNSDRAMIMGHPVCSDH